jgi:acyl-CoA thioester hydrolase
LSAFHWSARVYWEDTDGGGIVYYANYLKFLERARTEWLRSFGVSQQAMAREEGCVFTVVDLAVEYRRPARLDDELVITCEPQKSGAASIRFAQRVYRGAIADDAGAAQDAVLVKANVRVACVDAQTLTPRRMPDFLINLLSSKEPS